MKQFSSNETVVQVLSETFNAREGHRGVLARTIVLAGHVLEAGCLVHFTQEAGGVQSSLNSASRRYSPLDAVIHFGEQEPGRPCSTIRLRASGPCSFSYSVRDRGRGRGVATSIYRVGLTQRA